MITKEEIKKLEGNYFEVLQTEKTQAIIDTCLKGNIPRSVISQYTISIMMLMHIMPKGWLVIWQRQYPESCHMMNFR